MIKIFADATKAYASVDSVHGNVKIQESADQLVQWTLDWQIKCNSEKCKVLHTGKDQPEYNYYMNGKQLDFITAEKDLGIPIDTDLSFDNHLNEIVKQENKLTGILVGNTQCKDN